MVRTRHGTASALFFSIVLVSLLGVTSCDLLPKLMQSAEGGEPRVASVTIDLRPSPQARRVPSLLFGSNLQWEHSGDGTLTSENAWVPGLIDAIRRSGVTTLRFPGGSLSNTYRWKSGTGARDKRPTGTSFGGTQVPSTFGTDEYVRLCRDAGLEGVITVNLAAGTEEAAEWVRYVNGGPQPLGVKYWEIGNELYSPNEPGHLKAADYGRRVIEFSKAMKARDPSIKVGAHLEISFLQAAWMKNVFPHLLTWNEEVLQVCGRDIDFVVVHFYAPFDKVGSEEALHHLVWSGPLVFEQNLDTIRTLLRKHGRPGVEIALTEYGTFFGEKIAPDGRIGTTENALFSALILIACMRAPDVTVAHHWSLINNSHFGMLKTRGNALEQRPTYHVLEGLSPMAGGTLLPMRMDCDGYVVAAKGNIPALAKVPFVDGIAVRDRNGHFRATLVNRSSRHPLKVSLKIKGDRPPRQLKFRTLKGEEASWRILGPGRHQAAQDGTFELTLPPGSLSLIEGDD